MQVQHIGALAVFISSVCFGLLLFYSSKEHLKILEELLSLMRKIRELICVKRAPVRYVFSKLSSPALEKAGFYKKLYETNDLYISCLDLSLTHQELELISDFSSKIGKTCAKDQKEEFDYIITKTEEYIKTLRQELPKKQKLYLLIPPFSGLLIVVVFI